MVLVASRVLEVPGSPKAPLRVKVEPAFIVSDAQVPAVVVNVIEWLLFMITLSDEVGIRGLHVLAVFHSPEATLVTCPKTLIETKHMNTKSKLNLFIRTPAIALVLEMKMNEYL